MPTTLPFRMPGANAMSRREKSTSNPDLIAVAIFATVGLLVTILLTVYLPLRFPHLGALIEQYNQF